jgi:hypothetical protein
MDTYYTKYFQKSKVFLYPLLQLSNRKHDTEHPFESFTHVENAENDLEFLYSLVDPTVILRFKFDRSNDTEDSRKIWNIGIFDRYSKSNRIVKKYFSEDMSEIVLVYNLFDLKEDYDLVIAGRYSKISDKAKQRILTYYGEYTPEGKIVSYMLNPERHRKAYAEQMGIKVSDLNPNGEITPMLDLLQETLLLDVSNYNFTLYL